MQEFTKLRVGIVGCGAIAATHAAAYRAIPGVEVIGCIDADPDRAAEFAARHAIPWSGSDLAALPEADLVSVCTPHPTHERVVIAAAAQGLHVLCEKPLAAEPGAAERMIDACRTANVQLGTVFQRRFWPAAQRLKRALDDGTLGTPVLARVDVLLHRDRQYYVDAPWRGSRESGGGVLTTQAIHYLDLLQWYLGDVEWVCAASSCARHADVMEVEDTLVATMRFTNGALAHFTATTACTPGLGQRIAITGSMGGTIGLHEYPEGHEAIVEVWALPDEARFAHPTAPLPDAHLGAVNAELTPFHAEQIADFISAVRADREPAVTGSDALRSLRVMDAMYASTRTGQPLRLTDAPRSEAHPSTEGHSHA